MLPAALVEHWQVAIDAAGRALDACASLHVFSGPEQRARTHALRAERQWLREFRARRAAAGAAV